MKKVLILVVTLSILISCNYLNNIDYLPKTSMEFTHPHRKYNPVLKGSKLRMEYTFKNTGNHSLVIKEVQSSCDCTVIKKPEKAIGAGKTGNLIIQFETERTTGYARHYATVIANIENTLSNAISFETNVIEHSEDLEDYEERFFNKESLANYAGSYLPIEE